MTEITKLSSFPNYGVTKSGGVYSFYHNRFLKTPCNAVGYPEVNLYANGKANIVLVHRLIALTFLPNPDGKREVNHKNGIKHDNRVENLEWVTPSENISHAYRTGLHSDNKSVARCDSTGKVLQVFYSQGEAKKYGYDQRLISRAIKRGYKHRGYLWKEVMLDEVNS